MTIKLILGMLLVGLAPIAVTVGWDPEDQIPRLSVGVSLPRLRGEFLTARSATLPDEARGRVALLAFGFTYNSRFPVEAWCAGGADIAFYAPRTSGGRPSWRR
jgi:hypothetical protein